MARPRKSRNYCFTVEDIMNEKKRKEQERRENIRKGMLRYRETERQLDQACMSTEQMRQLYEKERLLWQLFNELNKENGTDNARDRIDGAK